MIKIVQRKNYFTFSSGKISKGNINDTFLKIMEIYIQKDLGCT